MSRCTVQISYKAVFQVKGVEEPLAEAEELVNLLYAQRQLENACLDRSIDDIEIAIEKIKSGIVSLLNPQLNLLTKSLNGN